MFPMIVNLSISNSLTSQHHELDVRPHFHRRSTIPFGALAFQPNEKVSQPLVPSDRKNDGGKGEGDAN